jgi:Uma2 family endonuclease
MVQHVAEPITTPRPRRMSYQQWRRWAAEQELRSEWVNGEVIEFMASSLRHADIVDFVFALLLQFVRFRNLGRVYSEAVEMRLTRSARLPDVLFVAADRVGQLEPTRLRGSADLVIEVISDDSVERDTEARFKEYAAAGVREYWVLDGRPDQAGARFYRLVGDDYQEAFPDADGRYHSSVVEGFWFRPDWLDQDPLPNPWPLVAEMAPEAALAALPPRLRPSDADES